MARFPGMTRQPGRRERFTHGPVEPRGRAREMGALGRDFQVQQGQLSCNVQRVSIVTTLCPRSTRRPRFPIPSLEPFPGPPCGNVDASSPPPPPTPSACAPPWDSRRKAYPRPYDGWRASRMATGSSIPSDRMRPILSARGA